MIGQQQMCPDQQWDALGRSRDALGRSGDALGRSRDALASSGDALSSSGDAQSSREKIPVIAYVHACSSPLRCDEVPDVSGVFMSPRLGYHKPAPQRQGCKDLKHGGVKADCCLQQHGAGASQVVFPHSPVYKVDQAVVVEHDALGVARAARGVDEVHHVCSAAGEMERHLCLLQNQGLALVQVHDLHQKIRAYEEVQQ